MKKLFSRKRGEEVTEELKPKENTGLSIARLNLVALFVALLVVLLSGYAAYLQFTFQLRASEVERHASQAREIAAQLSGRLQAMGEELERHAGADAALLLAIAEQDSAFLRRQEQQLAAVFPDALRIRYILPSEKDPDDSIVPRLSYACLDLARRAEEGAVPPAEVHLPGSEQQHIDLVRAVMDGDRPVASLMVTLDMAALQAWVRSLGPIKGHAAIQQGAEGKALTLAEAGAAAAQGREFLAAIDGSSWQIVYWPSNGIGLAEARQGGFLMTFVVAAGLLVVFFPLYGRFLTNLLQNDLKRLVGFIVDSSLGKRFQSYPVKLAESKQVLKEKEMDLSVLMSHAHIAETASRKRGHDQIPELAFDESFDVSVAEVDEKGKGARKDSSRQKK